MKVKEVIAWLVVLLFAFGVTGCGSLQEEFVKAVDTNWKAIGPDYRAYLEADKDLPQSSKELRLKTVAEFEELIKEAKVKAKIKDE